MKTRICAVGIVHNEKGEILVSKMPPNRGPYPGQWGILGGGMDEGEKIEDTLKREAREELGITVKNIQPFTFSDDEREKIFADGHKENIYMVYCLFDCEYGGEGIVMNDEWDEYRWVKSDDLKTLDLNDATRKTFAMKGWV